MALLRLRGHERRNAPRLTPSSTSQTRTCESVCGFFVPKSRARGVRMGALLQGLGRSADVGKLWCRCKSNQFATLQNNS